MLKTSASHLLVLALGACVVSVAQARPEDEQGAQNIVNGIEVGPEEFPETVFLAVSGSQGGGNCTGTLIDKEWVLTAGHCIDETTNGISVKFGRNASSPEFDVAADNWFSHPGWEGTDPNGLIGDDNVDDIAVVHLATPVTTVVPAGLNADRLDPEWAEVDITFVGYGITEFEGGNAGIKRKGTEEITSWTEQELSSFDASVSTCQGDSGGPGFRCFGDECIQVSVTSRGPRCGDGPSTHTRVDFYLPWLDENGVTYTTKPGSAPSYVCTRRLNPDEVDSDVIGNVPFDISCGVTFTRPDDIGSVDWSWGDGESSTGTIGTHEYTESGNFTVRMCATATEEAGGWEHCVSRVGHVTACAPPIVDFGYEVMDDGAFQFINRTDLSTWGCIFGVQWDIFRGTTATGEPMETIEAWEPEFVFDDKDTYTVVLNVGGLAGTSAAMLTLEGNNGRAGSCSHTGAAGGFGLLSLGLLLVGTRRRKS